jgi:hypothetical protein
MAINNFNYWKRGIVGIIFFCASFYCSAQEMIRNGDFTKNLSEWELSQNNATATATVLPSGPEGKPMVKIDVTKAGTATIDLQFIQKGIHFEANHTYVLSFWAMADKNLHAMVVAQNQSKKVIGEKNPANLTPQWKQYQYTLTSATDEPGSRILFNGLGAQTGSVWFALFSLQPGTATTIAAANEKQHKGKNATPPSSPTPTPVDTVIPPTPVPSTSESVSTSVATPASTSTAASSTPAPTPVVPASLTSIPQNSSDLLKNSDFAADLASWNFTQNNGAEASCQVLNDGINGKRSVQISVTKQGEKAIDVALSQKPVSIQAGQNYTVSFWAKVDGSNKNKLVIQLKQAKLGNNNAALKKEFSKITGQWQELKVDFTAPYTDNNAVFSVNVGILRATYWISGLSLVQGGPGAGPNPAATQLAHVAPQPAATPIAPATTPTTSASSASSSMPADDMSTDRGQIISVDASAKTITLSNVKSHDSEIFSVNERTKIVLNGVPATLADVKMGMIATVTPAADPLFAENVDLRSK